MLQLKRVEIHGFKSFADRTELRFDGSGIAGVVGPNGCGKSNVSDAISWVLGEQSAKSLRGARMQDVIFAGTRERKPLGMASVTITLVDPDFKPEPQHAGIIDVTKTDGVNGHANGHSNGHATNGHATNGHATNGHAVDGHAVNGHAAQVSAEGVEATTEDAVAAAPADTEATPAAEASESGEAQTPAVQASESTDTEETKPEEAKTAEAETETAGEAAVEAPSANALSLAQEPARTQLRSRFSEITVTRRIYRSGESEYLINGKNARLRDIQDIFMGTGLGPESYAIIEQGRIGQILSSKPQDRRSVIEEAAGITRFKNRRRLAEARLQGARHNLERVFDILEEVARQMNSLKRQAAKAKRYEELHTEMISSLRLSLRGKYNRQEREAARVALELGSAAKEVESVQKQLAAAEEAFRGTQAQSQQLTARLTEARERLAQATMELDRSRTRVQHQTTQADTLATRLEVGGDEHQSLGEQIQQLEKEKEAHTVSFSTVEAQLQEARQHFSGADTQRQEISRRLQERERFVESARQMSVRLLGEANQLRNQLAQVEEYLAGLERQKARHQAEEQIALGEASKVEEQRLDLDKRLRAQQASLATLVELRKETEQQVNEGRQRVHQARSALDAMRQEYSRIRARKDSLEDLISHRSYSTESVQRLFKAVEKGRANGLKPLGVLADYLEVEPAYEKAVEEFLHDELEYVVVESWDDGHLGVNLMRGEGDGRATFLLRDSSANIGHPCPVPELSSEQGVFARLLDVLQIGDAARQTALQVVPRIGRCFLVEETEVAQNLALRHPDCFFLTPDGLCFQGGSLSGGKKSASGPLVLKRQLKELQAKLNSTQEQVNQKEAALGQAEDRLGTLQEELEVLRAQGQTKEKEGVALEAEARKLSEEQRRAGSRLQVARTEMERLLRDADAALTRKESAMEQLQAKDGARQEQEQSTQTARGEIDELRKQVADLAEEHSTLRVAIAGYEERLRADRNALGRVDGLLRDSIRKRAELGMRMENEQLEMRRLRDDNAAISKRIQTLAEEQLQSQQEVSQLSATEANVRGGLSSQDTALQELRVRNQTQQDARTKLELDLVKRQAELRFLDETCQKELGIPIAEIEGSEDELLDGEALAAVEQQYLDLRRKIDQLGAVNANALEEYDEAERRHLFLSSQRQDLLDSIRDTEKAIKEIDEESRKRFTEAFHHINANFRQLFQTLFGGGTGEMHLADEENVSESGIEIVASPPGKRLQNVLLLSGGEKALTAIALLMAIFRYQPSPFCILDEVDAPLDEPNVVRYVTLIKEMSKQTQFIMITHAKRTMEAAQTLYGVTMQEAGVSKVVSVNFNGLNLPNLQPTRNLPRLTM